MPRNKQCKQDIPKTLLKTLMRTVKYKNFLVFFGEVIILKKKTFKHSTQIKDVSLSLKTGESLGIIGLNGSGKSTLMQIIAGTLKPSSGKVYMRGKVAAFLN